MYLTVSFFCCVFVSFLLFYLFFFFFNDTATTEIYTLSLHDALPISDMPSKTSGSVRGRGANRAPRMAARPNTCVSNQDRKSTRLNSSHGSISYAVFCLKKKKKKKKQKQKK